jgi:hypothetical protein
MEKETLAMVEPTYHNKINSMVSHSTNKMLHLFQGTLDPWKLLLNFNQHTRVSSEDVRDGITVRVCAL